MISELVILGTLLYGDEKYKHIALNSVKGYQFSGSFNRIIFEGCRESDERYNIITPDNVIDLTDLEVGTDYLSDFREYRASKLREIEGHCEKIADQYTRNSIIRGLSGIVLDEDTYESAKDIINDAESIISQTAIDVGMPGLTYSEMVERDENKPRYEKLDLGDPFWNQTFFRHCGCHKGQMTTVFGESKHCKSTAAMMYSRMLIDQGYKGLYTSFEDRDRKYAEYVLKGLEDESKIDNFIVTDHSQGCSTLEDIVTTAKYHKAMNDISFLIVDNAQIVEVDGLRFDYEKKRIVTISDRLRKLAIEEDIWVLMLSQISNERSRASGYDRQPKLNDMYGSGQIRKDSFMAIGIFKPSEVDELLVKNEFTGEPRGVKHPSGNDEIWPLSTVLMKQEAIREGEKYWKNVILNIRDDGLWRPTQEPERMQPNGVPF